MKLLSAMLVFGCTACGARSTLSMPTGDGGVSASSGSGGADGASCNWRVDGDPLPMTTPLGARFADAAPSLVAFPGGEVVAVYLRAMPPGSSPQLVSAKFASWEVWPPATSDASVIAPESCAPRITQAVDGAFDALVATDVMGGCQASSLWYSPITPVSTRVAPLHVAPGHFPLAAARGSGMHLLVLGDTVAQRLVARSIDDVGVIMTEQQIGCSSAIEPVAATRAKDDFYIAYGSDAPWLSCVPDGSYRVRVVRVNERDGVAALLAEWPIPDRVLSVAIAADENQLWCAWQDFGSSAESPPAVELARSGFDGSTSTPVSLAWTNGFFTPIALAALGHDDLALARFTGGNDRTSMAVDHLDGSGNRLAEAIFSTLEFGPGTPWVSLAVAPDGRALLSAWDGWDFVANASRVYVGRIGCVEP